MVSLTDGRLHLHFLASLALHGRPACLPLLLLAAPALGPSGLLWLWSKHKVEKLIHTIAP